jgi:hypothetical protein
MDQSISVDFDGRRFLQILSNSLKTYKPRFITHDGKSSSMRLAAVSVILRMRSTQQISEDELHKEMKTVEDFLNSTDFHQ